MTTFFVAALQVPVIIKPVLSGFSFYCLNSIHNKMSIK